MIWTALDEAELDVVVWTLVKEVEDHKAHCETCRETPNACQGFATAVREMHDWIRGRYLKSRLESIRAETVESKP